MHLDAAGAAHDQDLDPEQDRRFGPGGAGEDPRGARGAGSGTGDDEDRTRQRRPANPRPLPRRLPAPSFAPVTAPRFTIYSTASCGYCMAAKRLLEREGISYTEVDLTFDPALREEVSTRTGWRTVPMIFADGDFLGGYSELTALRSAGGLERFKIA